MGFKKERSSPLRGGRKNLGLLLGKPLVFAGGGLLVISDIIARDYSFGLLFKLSGAAMAIDVDHLLKQGRRQRRRTEHLQKMFRDICDWFKERPVRVGTQNAEYIRTALSKLPRPVCPGRIQIRKSEKYPITFDTGLNTNSLGITGTYRNIHMVYVEARGHDVLLKCWHEISGRQGKINITLARGTKNIIRYLGRHPALQ